MYTIEHGGKWMHEAVAMMTIILEQSSTHVVKLETSLNKYHLFQ